jgi:hypothetical protein
MVVLVEKLAEKFPFFCEPQCHDCCHAMMMQFGCFESLMVQSINYKVSSDANMLVLLVLSSAVGSCCIL